MATEGGYLQGHMYGPNLLLMPRFQRERRIQLAQNGDDNELEIVPLLSYLSPPLLPPNAAYTRTS